MQNGNRARRLIHADAYSKARAPFAIHCPAGDLTWQLARLEAEWLEVSEALEKLDLTCF